MTNILFVALIVLILVTTVINIVFLIAWLRGVGVLMLPGLGIVIAVPALVLLSSLFQLLFTILALVVDRYRVGPGGILMNS